MSFTFHWPRFSDQFHYDAIQMLNTALNKGNKPPIIADKIEVVELEMGTQPPELEIRDIGDLALDHFRGIFRLTYSGDAHLVLKTKVQANPLNHKQPDIHLMTGSRGMLAAKQPLVVPMLLRLSHFKLSSYVVLVVSKQKGITLVFKTDPLQNVDINSTFDSISVIQKFIQREIEGQLRQMFREDLPGIIHRLSQQWVKAKVETPYLSRRPHTIRRIPVDTTSNPEVFARSPTVSPQLLRKGSSAFGSHRPRSVSGVSTAKPSSPTKSAQSPSNDPQFSLHSDIENFDPTYGLRPEGLPTKSGFKGFSSLFTSNKGLADLAEELETNEGTDYGDAGTSFDVVDWEDTVPSYSPTSSVYHDRDDRDVTEYETVPAVGGGTITRPRIYHSQSAIQSHSSIHSVLSKPFSKQLQTGVRNGVPNLSIPSRTPSTVSNPYVADYLTGPTKLPGFHSTSSSTFSPISAPVNLSFSTNRPPSPDSLESEPSRSSSGPTRTLSTDPTEPTLLDEPPFHPLAFYAPSAATATSGIYMRRPPSERRMSVTSTTSTTNMAAEFLSTSPPNNFQDSGPDSMENPKIVLRPNSNNSSIHQLSTLSHSNHTLSPYTRDLSHFTVRSVPPRNLTVAGQAIGGFAFGVTGGDRQPVKARRKRIYRISGRGNGPPRNDKVHDSTPTLEPPPELDISEMDRYFSPGEFDEQQTASAQMKLPSNRRPSPIPSFSFLHDPSINSELLRNRVWSNPDVDQ